ncbi:DUF222 domain-containing protein [Demequina sp. SO4-18]|uniref:HNH endonuclease signature motif containing protein n=1 Tax=Demequina sp. SO4-18 TaxID=3401026 RepID=UPI003B59DB95
MAIETAEIERVSALVGELASRDVSGLSKDELLGLNGAIAKLERQLGALSSRCAGEIARRSSPDLPGGGLARREGHGNAKTLLSKVRGGTQSGAQKSMEAGEAFVPVTPPTDGPVGLLDEPAPAPAPRPKYPAVAAASVAGELSVDAASLIVAGLNKLAGSLDDAALVALEERLVSRAVSMSAHEVRKMVTRAVARADAAALKERERHNHEERYLWWKQDSDGNVVFHGQMDAVTAAPIIAVLEQMTTRDVRRKGRKKSSDTRTVGQMRADALFELARHCLGCTKTEKSGVRTSLVVRMSQSGLMSGQGLGSIDGIDQPVSVGELRRLSGDAGIIPQVLGGESEVLDQGVEERLFTDEQRIALLHRDGGCAKCHAPPQHCEAHHIRWWQHGGLTDIDNGVMLCTRCHHDIHNQGWEIVATRSSVSFIPPPSIDPGRTPCPGGSAALDVQVPPPPELDWPPITAQDEAMVRQWAAADRQREQDADEDAWELAELRV